MHLKDLLSKQAPFENTNVALIGDLMLDTFIYGGASRISPEAPVPVVSVRERTLHLGGAGNAAANILALGASPILVARVGTDDAAENIKTICNQMKLDASYLVTTAEPTTSKTRIIAQGQQVARLDEETIAPLDQNARQKVIESLSQIRKEADVILVSDYAKGVIDQELLDSVKEIWKTGTILIDPKPRSSIDYSGVNFITPNLKEANELIHSDEAVDNDKKAEDLVLSLANKLNIDSVLLTRSADGVTLLTQEQHGQKKVIHQKVSELKEIRDVSGAGDTVIAALSSGLAIGLPTIEAVELANLAAGIAVGHAGTVSVSWEELVESLKD